MDLTCRLMSGGAVLEETTISLEPKGQTSWFLEDEFTMSDTTDFAGTVRCTAQGSGGKKVHGVGGRGGRRQPHLHHAAGPAGPDDAVSGIKA